VTLKQAYKPRTKGVPVRNKDTGRTVYILKETLKQHPERFEKEREDKVGDPRWRGKPKPPRKPEKPKKPEIPRESPPAPIRPQIRRKRVKRMKPVTEVPEVKPTKVPTPSPPRRWKQLKRYKPTASAESVLRRYLEALDWES
jgi:hypothetical protein